MPHSAYPLRSHRPYWLGWHGMELVLFCLVAACTFAQEPETRLDAILERKGQVATAQYYEVGVLTKPDGGVRMDVAVFNITELSTRETTKEIGLRIQIKTTSRHEDRTSVLDSRETASLAEALPLIVAAQKIPRGDEVSRYVVFIAGNFTLRVRQGEAGEDAVFSLKLGDIGPAEQVFQMQEFPAFQGLVVKAAAKIKALQE